VRIIGTLFQRVEHVGARGALVHQRAIAVILEEMTTIEYRQGDGHVEVRCRGHIAEYITVRVLLPMTVGLLEAELDEETEELPRVECTGDVRGVRVVRLQRQTEQPHAQDARQPTTGGHFSKRGRGRGSRSAFLLRSPDRLVPREPSRRRADDGHPQHLLARQRAPQLLPHRMRREHSTVPTRPANTFLIEARRDPRDTPAAATFSSCCRRLVTVDVAVGTSGRESVNDPSSCVLSLAL